MDLEGIKQLIPHRYPFLLVDRIEQLDERSIQGIKNVTADEPYFAGHFPNYPIMPGVLILESIAQTCCVMLMHNNPELRTRTPLFLAVENARFRRPVRPGTTLRLFGETVNRKGNIWKLRGRAEVEGEVACTMDFLAGFGPD